MAKKVFFLGRGAGKGAGGGGRPPYVKYLLLAILGLSVAIVAASYLLSSKGRDTTTKTLSEKPTVKKELPKPPEPAPGELPTAEKLAAGPTAKPEPAPEPPKQPEPAPQLEPPPAAQPVQPEVAKPAEPAPRDIFPKGPAAPPLSRKVSPPPPAEKGVKKEPARQVRPSPVETGQKAVKAAPKGGMFVVQVGSYKEKQAAEEVRQRLRKKGYDVRLCPSGLAGSGNYTFKVITNPVNKSKAYSLAEQLKAEKVSPTVIAAPVSCGLDSPAALKAAMKRPVAKSEVKPASSTKKSKATPTSKVQAQGSAKTVKTQAATASKSKSTDGKNSGNAASKPKTTPTKAVATQ